MSFYHDPELPAGYQDADFEMAELEDAARQASAMRRAGKCTHGWSQGLAADGTWRGDGPAPAPGQALCLHCGAHFPGPVAR